jgi:uncharacterized protein
MKKNLMIIVITIILTSTSAVQAVSFDCAKATTAVEKMICDDEKLSKLDDALDSVYRESITVSSDIAPIKKGQMSWLKKRNACKDKKCIKKLYNKRTAELRKLNPLPKRIGSCIDVKIISKNTRFEDAVAGEVGGEVYVIVEGVGLYVQSVPHLIEGENTDKYMFTTDDFSKGDKVALCLKELPKDCPPGDDRGKVYKVTNFKNKKSFIGVDSWHLCGGA